MSTSALLDEKVNVDTPRPASGWTTRWYRTALPAILIVTFLYRLRFGGHSLWFDEQASVFFSDQSFSRLWSDWMVRETNPPLYYSILRLWRLMFGSSDLMIRLPSILASICAIWMIHRITAATFGRRAGTIAALLSAISGQNLYFAEQARAYVFVFLAALVAIGALLVLCREDVDTARRQRAWAVFVTAAVAGAYLHTTMLLFVWIALAAFTMSAPDHYIRTPRRLVAPIAAAIIVGVLSGWALRHAAIQMTTARDNISPIGLATPRLVVRYAIDTLFLTGSMSRFPDAIALTIAALATTAAIRWRARREVRLLALLGGGALATFALLGQMVPVLVPRTIYWISIVPAILASATLASIRAATVRHASVAALCLCLAFDTVRMTQRLEQEDWNEPLRHLAAHPTAILLVQGDAMALLAQENCRRQLGRQTCPHVIVDVVDPKDHYDTWATGLYAGPRLTVEALAGLPPGQQVFLFRKGFAHSLPVLLHRSGMGHGLAPTSPRLVGPMFAADLK